MDALLAAGVDLDERGRQVPCLAWLVRGEARRYEVIPSGRV